MTRRWTWPAIAGVLLLAGLAGGMLYPRLSERVAPSLPVPESALPEPQAGTLTISKPKPVPALAFVDGDGRALSLDAFKGRVVLLNLWATWCVPCRREMPTLDRLQARLGGPAFTVVALSIDRQGVSVVKPFYQQLGLTSLALYVDRSGQAVSALGALGVPITVLIDRDGQEIGRRLGPADWDSEPIVALIRQHLDPVSGGARSAGARPAP
jgi:thiol-disulfide isomerase/thioredoxin